MLHSEFIQRTGVEVSNYEFDAINEVYMNSDLDKDEFCKVWCKMNASRVKRAKNERILAERKDMYTKILERWYMRWVNSKNFKENYYTNIAHTRISTVEIKAMSFLGVRFGNAEVLSDVHYKVGKVLGYIK